LGSVAVAYAGPGHAKTIQGGDQDSALNCKRSYSADNNLDHLRRSLTSNSRDTESASQIAVLERFLEAVKLIGAVAERLGFNLGSEREVGEPDKSSKLLI
jgi:hypothetical protein